MQTAALTWTERRVETHSRKTDIAFKNRIVLSARDFGIVAWLSQVYIKKCEGAPGGNKF